jgi:hypothetical protein
MPEYSLGYVAFRNTPTHLDPLSSTRDPKPGTRNRVGCINSATVVYQDSYAWPLCFSSGLISRSKIPPSLQHIPQTLCNCLSWHLACHVSVADNSFEFKGSGFALTRDSAPGYCTAEARGGHGVNQHGIYSRQSAKNAKFGAFFLCGPSDVAQDMLCVFARYIPTFVIGALSP